MVNVGKVTIGSKVYLVQRASCHEGRQVYVDAAPLEQYPAVVRQRVRELLAKKGG